MCKQTPTTRTRGLVKRPQVLDPMVINGHRFRTTVIVRVGWQSNTDLPIRRRILSYIRMAMASSISNRPDVLDLLEKLPKVSAAAELLLYHAARTKEEYLDLSTLRHRLRVVKEALGSFDEE